MQVRRNVLITQVESGAGKTVMEQGRKDNSSATNTMQIGFLHCISLSIFVTHPLRRFFMLTSIAMLHCVYRVEMHQVIERVSHLDPDNCTSFKSYFPLSCKYYRSAFLMNLQCLKKGFYLFSSRGIQVFYVGDCYRAFITIR